jgi:hypothetical protein
MVCTAQARLFLTPLPRRFVHHTPVFFPHSPHDFQIILLAELLPLSVGDNVTYIMKLPYPPHHPLVVDEFTFTPPPPFSLNDLLNGQITTLLGVVYNGSFDTVYERQAMALAKLTILDLTTAVYLNDSHSIAQYPSMQYLSYPRAYPTMPRNDTSAPVHFYLSHEIHAPPDFDQVVHASITPARCKCVNTGGCNTTWLQTMQVPGSVVIIPALRNVIDQRLQAGQTLSAAWSAEGVACPLDVLEEIHCVSGPAFSDRCVPLTSPPAKKQHRFVMR